jgi:hypothetical protein
MEEEEEELCQGRKGVTSRKYNNIKERQEQ